MFRKIIWWVLLLVLAGDIFYSFLQHRSMPLDGDMAGGIILNGHVKKILDDPFGISVISDNEDYANANRYFSHLVFYSYFSNVPLFLQSVTKPIESVYSSCAFAKTFIQVSIIFLLTISITGIFNPLKKEFLIAAVLITPLFQTNGYTRSMGIIDPSPTYSFFYALPILILLAFFLPFFLDKFYNKSFIKKLPLKLSLLVLAIILPFTGPLIPGIILILNVLLVANDIKKNGFTYKTIAFKPFNMVQNTMQIYYSTCFFLITILCIYSLYIGKNNTGYTDAGLSLFQRYMRIPSGLYSLFLVKLGPSLLLIAILLNLFLIKKMKFSEGEKILTLAKWIGAFAVLYIILLPLGGYKNYRPNILRYDTFIPVTLSLIFLYGKSTYFLISNFPQKKRISYLPVILIFSFVFFYVDQPEFGKNACEKNALEKLSTSRDKIVLLDNNCTILYWEKLSNPEDSRPSSRLLQHWRITKEEKLYYQNDHQPVP